MIFAVIMFWSDCDVSFLNIRYVITESVLLFIYSTQEWAMVYNRVDIVLSFTLFGRQNRHFFKVELFAETLKLKQEYNLVHLEVLWIRCHSN